MKILFILKRKDHPYDEYGHGHHKHDGDRFLGTMSTGLLNSVKFVERALLRNKLDVKVVVVTDNNDIDREVTQFRPDIVIIEALWVVPEKFEVLIPLHPNVKWVVRLHSAIPFIANEGIAMKWALNYLDHEKVFLSCNDARILSSLRWLAGHLKGAEAEAKILFQPNIYEKRTHDKALDKTKTFIDVGCFGAIRPMKNQLAQAIAAIKFAESIGKTLNFHINGSRVEMKGSPVLHNLQGLFEHAAAKGHKLVTHEWLEHDEFRLLCRSMDIGLQVSNSETFNIVAADMVSSGVPVVGSKEISWLPKLLQADPADEVSMVRLLRRAYRFPNTSVSWSRSNLRKLSNSNLAHWMESLSHLV